jgi:hypothetical protein
MEKECIASFTFNRRFLEWDMDFNVTWVLQLKSKIVIQKSGRILRGIQGSHEILGMRERFLEFDMNCEGGMRSWISFQGCPLDFGVKPIPGILARRKN